jgi:hypothetical protein
MADTGAVDRDECVYMAKLAEQAERYDEMVRTAGLRGAGRGHPRSGLGDLQDCQRRCGPRRSGALGRAQAGRRALGPGGAGGPARGDGARAVRAGDLGARSQGR